ncbi:hypothetical protein [Nesterenkonia alkaliphila]|uniref:Uncharacterized protein n=1 Tax=Nesterenkonia alkaliphila TaxID=1463631 RepID=A0A7K1UKX3_9MICC|nr:hypothetical protein [Nesterenkonia alkaliphila]MVT27120.1 hypothetical protein [Nesterenkonia alkaliphila]GFZ89238.1 hypothetical protein GCM10011359_18190 [Nesterenkonia alkaliphila]
MGDQLKQEADEATREPAPWWKGADFRSGIALGCALGLIISVLFVLWVMNLFEQALSPP